MTIRRAFVRYVSCQNSQLDFQVVRVKHPAQEEYALSDKICNETIGRLVIEIIGRIPLLDFAMMHDADFICDGKSLVLIMGHQYSRCVLALENVAYFQAQT